MVTQMHSDYKPQPLSKSVNKPLFDICSQNARTWADLDVGMRTDIEAIAESLLTRWTNMPELQLVKNAQSTFEDTLQARLFNWSNGLQSAIFNILEQGLGQVVRSGRDPTVSWV